MPWRAGTRRESEADEGRFDLTEWGGMSVWCRDGGKRIGHVGPMAVIISWGFKLSSLRLFGRVQRAGSLRRISKACPFLQIDCVCLQVKLQM